MVAAACLTLALIHLRIAFGDGRRAPHLFFSLAAVAVAVISLLELTLLCTTEVTDYDRILRWSSIPIAVMVISVVGFVRTFFGTGRNWLAWPAVALILLSQLANFISPVPAVRHAVAIHRVQTYGGECFTVPTIASSPWTAIEIASVILAVIFVLDASIALWKKGERRRPLIVGGGIIFFFCASRGHAILVEKGLVQTPYLVSFAFLGVILAMGHELSADVLRDYFSKAYTASNFIIAAVGNLNHTQVRDLVEEKFASVPPINFAERCPQMTDIENSSVLRKAANIYGRA